MTDHVLTENSNGVLTIQLNRADKRNALTQPMYSIMAEALGVAEADPDVRVILLTGSGGCFTAGNDLAGFLEGPSLDLDGPTIAFMRALARTTKVVVAQVDGPAVGVGTTMLMHCDLVYATARSKFALPFVNLGIVPEFGASTILPKLLGRQAAAHVLLFGEPFSAAQALEYGLVTEVLPDADALAERVSARVAALVAKPPLALAATRRLLRPADEVADLVAYIEAEALVFRERVSSDEAKAAIAAMQASRSSKSSARPPS